MLGKAALLAVLSCVLAQNDWLNDPKSCAKLITFKGDEFVLKIDGSKKATTGFLAEPYGDRSKTVWARPGCLVKGFSNPLAETDKPNPPLFVHEKSDPLKSYTIQYVEKDVLNMSEMTCDCTEEPVKQPVNRSGEAWDKDSNNCAKVINFKGEEILITTKGFLNGATLVEAPFADHVKTVVVRKGCAAKGYSHPLDTKDLPNSPLFVHGKSEPTKAYSIPYDEGDLLNMSQMPCDCDDVAVEPKPEKEKIPDWSDIESNCAKVINFQGEEMVISTYGFLNGRTLVEAPFADHVKTVIIRKGCAAKGYSHPLNTKDLPNEPLFVHGKDEPTKSYVIPFADGDQKGMSQMTCDCSASSKPEPGVCATLTSYKGEILKWKLPEGQKELFNDLPFNFNDNVRLVNVMPGCHADIYRTSTTFAPPQFEKQNAGPGEYVMSFPAGHVSGVSSLKCSCDAATPAPVTPAPITTKPTPAPVVTPKPTPAPVVQPKSGQCPEFKDNQCLQLIRYDGKTAFMGISGWPNTKSFSENVPGDFEDDVKTVCIRKGCVVSLLHDHVTDKSGNNKTGAYETKRDGERASFDWPYPRKTQKAMSAATCDCSAIASGVVTTTTPTPITTTTPTPITQAPIACPGGSKVDPNWFKDSKNCAKLIDFKCNEVLVSIPGFPGKSALDLTLGLDANTKPFSDHVQYAVVRAGCSAKLLSHPIGENDGSIFEHKKEEALQTYKIPYADGVRLNMSGISCDCDGGDSSSGSKDKVTTTEAPAVKPPPPPPVNNCVDTATDCGHKSSLCYNNAYKSLMKKRCPHTCGFC